MSTVADAAGRKDGAADRTDERRSAARPGEPTADVPAIDASNENKGGRRRFKRGCRYCGMLGHNFSECHYVSHLVQDLGMRPWELDSGDHDGSGDR